MEWNWIIQTATMLGIGAIGYFLKTTMAELKTQINKNAQDVDELKKNWMTYVPISRSSTRPGRISLER
ncbi:hypothetical protein WJ0W_003569 [Paenibacillus melissococcoides]|uniref:Uncharacterized protein n=1 Tax=Paenibacillus melissococcoides TaxID=2912268 RepID=A0ABM9G403_9BACL|nr:hypothetical protein [Paenibacillus melissococcoides]CAH8246334.1 hypothetical protein WJ0W_003569 [Paenibacillus melissococcoides]